MEIKKKLGFGCMRLPFFDNNTSHIDYDTVNKMVDYFIDKGFNYFDTARVYHQGFSEVALNKCLTSRHKRDEYLIADKLSFNLFEKESDLEPLFKDQLKTVGVDYFDYYLMHAQNANFYKKYKETNAYEFGLRMKEEGYIKHLGLSFHDTPEVLEMILNEKPFVEFVQLQFNYADYLGDIKAKECYDIAVKHGKKVIVMEPIRGGRLAKLPESEHNKLTKFGNYSDAGFAVRFAASFDNILVVLSGMSNLEQVIDNTSYMSEFKKMDKEEIETCLDIANQLRKTITIPCTACKYCVDGCPKHIHIPEIFKLYNDYCSFNGSNLWKLYHLETDPDHKASDCIKCGKCEGSCPQHIQIREFLEKIAKAFE